MQISVWQSSIKYKSYTMLHKWNLQGKEDKYNYQILQIHAYIVIYKEMKINKKWKNKSYICFMSIANEMYTLLFFQT